MENSSHQCANAFRSYSVIEGVTPPRRVLLVDDIVDSRWTLTVCGYRLMEAGLALGAPVIEYLADSMLKKMNKSAIIKAIRESRMLLLSVTKPDAPFNVGVAMMRNRYIYAQSSGTVVIRSEYNKGGTWAGAIENLKYGLCKEFCRDKKNISGQ